MNIGIKYCGGCQSRYDRAKVVSEIISMNKKCNFEYVKDYKVYDYIIIVCGCHIKCPDISRYIVKKEFIFIDKSSCFIKLL